MFPDDAVTAGFDKVGEGLTLSATGYALRPLPGSRREGARGRHLSRGRTSLLAGWPQILQGKREDFHQLWKLGGGQSVRSHLADVLSLHRDHGALGTLERQIPDCITAQARNNGGKSMPIAIGIHNRQDSKPDAPELLDMRDLSETEMRTVTMEADLQTPGTNQCLRSHARPPRYGHPACSQRRTLDEGGHRDPKGGDRRAAQK